jgi:hypothetical protein
MTHSRPRERCALSIQCTHLRFEDLDWRKVVRELRITRSATGTAAHSQEYAAWPAAKLEGGSLTHACHHALFHALRRAYLSSLE